MGGRGQGGTEGEKTGCNEDKKAEHLKIIRALYYLAQVVLKTDEMDNSIGKILNKLDSSREGKLKPISILKIGEVINRCAMSIRPKKTIFFSASIGFDY